MRYKTLKPLHVKGKKTIQVGTIVDVPKDIDKKSADILVEKKAIQEIKDDKK